ncbi:trypsin [Trichuris suis]|nr:trypsin [Trichuris suis]
MLHLKHWALYAFLYWYTVSFTESFECGYPETYGGKAIGTYLKENKLVLPWTVVITNNLRQFQCLGSIISEEGAPGSKKNGSSLVLTAGNCFRYNFLKRWGSTSSFRVFAGVDRFRLFGAGAEKAYVKRIKIIPFIAANDNIWHGIALVTLKSPLMFSKLISPVCVAKQLIPPKSSRCFVSTYVKNRLDEEVVDLVPGALCDFGEFPELKRVGGICSIHQKADSERSFGGPLVCLVDGRAYQFGIYLSQLSVKEALFQNSALHYYGHSAKLFSNDPSISTYVIGLESKPSASKDATSKGCDKAESTLKETDNSCSLKPSKPTTPVDSAEQKGPALCGTTAIFGRTLESYIEGRTAQDMFPWNVFIVTKLRGTVKCIGSVIHAGKYEQHANASDVVLTAAQCFRQNAYTSAALTSSMSVYASSNKYSWFRGKGIKLSIVNIYPYGRGSVKGEAQNELALLKIQRPLSIQDKVIPVCLAPREELPPLESFCYVTHYDILEQRIDEDPVRLTHKRRCSLNQTQNEPNAEGLCTNEEKPKHYVQLGAPMVCIVNGRAYQYGVYLRQHNLQINQKVTQGLGFYCRISKIYDILDGKLVTPPRDNSITKPSEPSIPPTKLPSIFVPAVSTSQSSSSSNEKDATRPKPNVLTVLPSEPNSPSASNLHQGLVYPIKPATKGKSKSSSSSLSISKSRSSSSEQIKEEIEEEPALPEQPAIEQPVLKKNETTIVVKFPQLKYPKFVPKRESNEEPIIVSSVSSESKESEVPVIFPTVRPSPPHGDVPLAPLPSTPAPVKLESVSKSSSHSRSSSRSSMSGEVIKPAESDEISIPSHPLPSRPCELDTNNPNGVLICPGIRDEGKGITHTVPLPTPVPAAEYPSSSLESSERRIYPSIPEYDMTEQTIADHEHILVSDIAVHESAVAGATSTLCTINDESFSSSQPSAITGGISSGSNIYDSTGAAAVVSNSGSGIHGSTGASLSGVSTSIGIIHGSASISSGAGLSVSRVHGSAGVSSSGIQTSIGTTSGSKGTSTGVSISGIGMHGSRGASSSSSGIHTSIGSAHGSTGTSSGVSTSIGRIQGSSSASSSARWTQAGNIHGSTGTTSGTGMSSGSVQGSVSASLSGKYTSTSSTHGSTGTSSGVSTSIGSSHTSNGVSSTGSSSSNCITNAHGSSSMKHLPGANAVHIFDVSQSSAEDVCTGSLHVKAGEMYSDIVVTSARCVWSRVSRKYKVYAGSLLPRHMTMAQFNRTLISVERIFTLPFYSEYSSLKAMGIAVLKLKHKVKVIAGVQSFPLPYPETAPTPRMECFVSGICQHGMPVRVKYQLLNAGDCWSRLGRQFLPNVQYCGIGRKDILKFPVGAPLVCDFSGTWVQFGIYDHAPRFGKLDHFGTKEDEKLNEITVFMKLEGDSVSEMLRTNKLK